MKNYNGKVSVITGAASGIGWAVAKRCAMEGMRVVLADIEGPALLEAEKALRAGGAEVLSVLTDVSRAQDMETLARNTLDAFGGVHLLFNNAGVVGAVTSIWKSTLEDWQWVMGVNLYGIIHGIRIFIPIMLAQDSDCYVVNTSSIGALIYGPGGLYSVSKHAVVGVSETLHRELAEKRSRIKVSVFCPGFVNTRIMDSDRNSPFGGVKNLAGEQHQGLEHARRLAVQKGIQPEEAAEILFRGIEEERFYIFTHPELKSQIRQRMTCILEERSPVEAK